jgi:hypothetical protein
MLPLKSRELEAHNLASRSPTVQAELEALAQLSFSFEMDGFHGQGGSNPHSHNTEGSRSRSASTTPSLNTNTVSEFRSHRLDALRLVQRHDQQDTTELDQLVAAAGILPRHMFPPHSYSSTMPPMSDPHARHLNLHDMQLPQLSSTDLNWLQQALNQEHHAQGSTSGAGLSNNYSLHSQNMPTAHDSGAPSSSSFPTVDNQTEGDLALNNDEKRRRNTAASGEALPLLR